MHFAFFCRILYVCCTHLFPNEVESSESMPSSEAHDFSRCEYSSSYRLPSFPAMNIRPVCAPTILNMVVLSDGSDTEVDMSYISDQVQVQARLRLIEVMKIYCFIRPSVAGSDPSLSAARKERELGWK